MRAFDPLHGHPEGPVRPFQNGHRVERLHQCRASIPGRAGGTCHDVIALKRGHGDAVDARQTDSCAEVADAARDALEAFLHIADDIHLVDRHYDVADSRKGREVRLTAAAGAHPRARVHDEQGQVGGGHQHAGRGMRLFLRCDSDVCGACGCECVRKLSRIRCQRIGPLRAPGSGLVPEGLD